jgi:hypothetical protein
MKSQSLLFKYHRVILYLTTIGLIIYGVMAIFNPEILAGGFNRFTKQDWGQFHTNSQDVAGYITLLWRLIGGFNLATGIILTLIVWRWLLQGRRWAWVTLFLGTAAAYLSPMSLDLTTRSIEIFEVLEFALFGLFALTMLLIRRDYFTTPVVQESLD